MACSCSGSAGRRFAIGLRCLMSGLVSAWVCAEDEPTKSIVVVFRAHLRPSRLDLLSRALFIAARMRSDGIGRWTVVRKSLYRHSSEPGDRRNARRTKALDRPAILRACIVSHPTLYISDLTAAATDDLLALLPIACDVGRETCGVSNIYLAQPLSNLHVRRRLPNAPSAVSNVTPPATLF
jgi:hypothetical protein